MSSLKNRVILIGHLGAAPEVKTIGEDRKMCKFSLATNEYYYDAKGVKQTDTQWHRLVAWGKLAEVTGEYLKKGQEIACEGKLVTREYQNDADEKRYITEVHLSDFNFLGGKKNS